MASEGGDISYGVLEEEQGQGGEGRTRDASEYPQQDPSSVPILGGPGFHEYSSEGHITSSAHTVTERTSSDMQTGEDMDRRGTAMDGETEVFAFSEC